MKRKPEAKTPEPQKFAVGETVKILRPHLWSGCVGCVVSFAGGLHRIKIEGRPDGANMNYFHADVPASQLEEFI